METLAESEKAREGTPVPTAPLLGLPITPTAEDEPVEEEHDEYNRNR